MELEERNDVKLFMESTDKVKKRKKKQKARDLDQAYVMTMT
jgi:hypothetical protein